jgi:hypothetical protein
MCKIFSLSKGGYLIPTLKEDIHTIPFNGKDTGKESTSCSFDKRQAQKPLFHPIIPI